MRFKRLTAIMATIAMIAGMFVSPDGVLAEATYPTSTDIYTHNDERATYSYRLLGTTDADTGMSITSLDDITPPGTVDNQSGLPVYTYDWKKGDYLWVGVELKDMNASRLNTYGANITNLGSSVVYNNKALEFKGDTSTNFFSLYSKLVASDSAMTNVSANYSFSDAGVNAFPVEKYTVSWPDYPKGPSEQLAITADYDDISQAVVTLNLKDKKTKYILTTPDANAHLVAIYPFEMISDSKPEDIVVQGFSNATSTTFTSLTSKKYTGIEVTYGQYYKVDTENPVDYPNSEYMAYFFNIEDPLVNLPDPPPEDATPTPTPEPVYLNPVVSPRENLYDKNEDQISNHVDQSYEYNPRDGGGLARLTITTTGDEPTTIADYDITDGSVTQHTAGTGKDTSGVTVAIADNGHTTVTLSSDYLSGYNTGDYTLTFTQGSDGDQPAEQRENPTASLTVKETPLDIKVKLTDAGTKKTGEGVVGIYRYVTAEDGDGSGLEEGEIYTQPITAEADGSYILTPDETYMVRAKYDKNETNIEDYLKWTLSPNGDNIESSLSEIDGAEVETEGDFSYSDRNLTISSNDPDLKTTVWEIVANYGGTDPTLAVTIDGEGTGTVTVEGVDGTANPTGVAGSEGVTNYTLASGGKYKITATATSGTRSVFTGWSGIPSDGDIDATTYTGQTTDITFTASHSTDNEITANFNLPTPIVITTAVAKNDPSESVLDGCTVSVYEGSSTSAMSNNGTANKYNTYSDTSYKLTATPADGKQFVKWTSSLDSTFADTSATITVTPSANVTYTAIFADSTGASLSPATQTWDKVSDASNDVEYEYTYGDYPNVTTVKIGTTTLTSSDYTVGSAADGKKTITIKKEKLATIASGTYTVSVQAESMPDEAIPTAELKITDSSQNGISVDVSGLTKALNSYKHGERINLDGFKVTLNREGEDPEVWTYSSADQGWKKGTDTAVSTEPFKLVYADDDSDITYKTASNATNDIMRYSTHSTNTALKTHTGSAIKVVYTGTEDALKSLTGSSGTSTISVAKQTLAVTAEVQNSSDVKVETPTKTYDGGTSLPTGNKVVVDLTDASKALLVSDDGGITVTLDGTPVYSGKNANTGIGITYAVKLAGTSTGGAADAELENYTITTKPDLTGTIEKIALVVDEITNVPSTPVNTPVTNGTGTAKIGGTDATADLKSDSPSLVTGETVTFQYTYTYADDNNIKTAGTGKPVTIAATCTVTDSPANYTVTYDTSSDKTKGTVTRGTYDHILVNHSGTPYTYGSNDELDMTKTTVTLCAAASDTTGPVYTWTADETGYKWVNATDGLELTSDELSIVWTGSTTTPANDTKLSPIGIKTLSSAQTFTATYTIDTNTQLTAASNKIVVNPKAITLTKQPTVVTDSGSIDKIFDGTRTVNVSAWNIIPENGQLETADEGKVTVTATAAYDNANVKRDASNDVVARDIKFTPTGLAGTNADNYTISGMSATYVAAEGANPAQGIPNQSGIISPREIKLSSITLPTATQNDENSGKGTIKASNVTDATTYKVAATFGNSGQGGVVTNVETNAIDPIKISVTYDYKSYLGEHDYGTSNTWSNVTFTYDSTNATTTGVVTAVTQDDANSSNYTLVTTDSVLATADIKGNVTKAEAYGISLNAPTKSEYTHIKDDKLDLTGTVVTINLNADGTSTKKYIAEQTTAGDGSTLKWYDYDGNTKGSEVSNPPFALLWKKGSSTSAVTGSETMTPSTWEGNQLIARQTADTSKVSDPVSLTLNKLPINAIEPVIDGTITKVYNNSNALTNANKSAISYKAYYDNASSTKTELDTIPGTLTVSVTYKDENAGTENLVFGTPSLALTGNDAKNYQLTATAVTADTALQGTITQRPITVTLKTSNVTSRTVDDTEWTVALTSSNYDVTLDTNGGNTGETAALISGDGVAVGGTVTYTETPNQRSYGSYTVAVDDGTFVLTGTKAGNYSPTFVTTGATLTGNVTANTRTLTVTAAGGTVTINGEQKNSASVVYTQNAAIKVEPNEGYVFKGWTSSTDNIIASTAGNEVTITMPDKNVTAVAQLYQLPGISVAAPKQIDKANSDGFSFKYSGDYGAPTQVKIGDTTYSSDDFTVNTSTKTVTIPKAKIADLTTSTEDQTLEATFDVPDADITSEDVVDTTKKVKTDTVKVINTTSSTFALQNVAYTQPDGTKEYGKELDLTSFVFDLVESRDGETDKVTKYKYDDGWKKSTDGGTTYTDANLATDNLKVTWSTGDAATQGQKLYNSLHDGKKLQVSYNNGTPVTGTQDDFVVAKKQLTVSVTGTGITKVYDGTDSLDNSGSTANKDKIEINVSGTISGDTITATVDNSNTKFNQKTVDATKVNVAYTLAGANAKEYYISDSTAATVAGSYTGELDGTITPKEIKISSVVIPKRQPTDSRTQGFDAQSYSTVAGNSITFETTPITADQSSLSFSVYGQYSGDNETSYTFTEDSTQTPVSSPASGTYRHAVSGDENVTKNYSFVWTDATASGEVSTKTVQGLSIKDKDTKPAQTRTTQSAGTALDLSDLTVVVEYTDGTSEEVPASQAAAKGITLTWSGGNADGTAVTGGDPLTTDHNGSSIKATKSGKEASTNAYSVEQRVLKVNITATGVTKVYDGLSRITTGTLTAASFADGTDANILAADADVITLANINIVTEYSSKNVGSAIALNTPTLTWKTAAAAKGANYKLEAVTDNTFTGAITPREIKIASITADPAILNDTSDLDRSKSTTNLATLIADGTVTLDSTSSSILTGDVITVAYTAAYTAAQVASTADSVDLPLSDTSSSIRSSTAKPGDYVVTFPENATGSVAGKNVKAITVTKKPNKTSYIHGDTFSLDGMQIKLEYNRGNDDYYTYADGKWHSGQTATGAETTLPDGVTVTWETGTTSATDSPEYNSANSVAARFDSTHFTASTATQPTKFGNILVSDSETGKSASFQVDVSKRQVTLTVSGAIEKIYDGDAAVETADVKTAVDYTWSTDVTQYDTGFGVDTDASAYTFNSKNVHDDKIKFTDGIKYTNSTAASNYTITINNNATSKITPKTLNITEITEKVEALVGDSAEGTLTVDNTGYTTSDLIGDDNVTIAVKYAFPDGTATATTGDVNLTIKGENGNPKIVISEYDPANDAGQNYVLGTVAAPKGSVANKNLGETTLTAPTDTEYVHGETLDLTGTKLVLNYTNGDPQTFEYNNGWKDGAGNAVTLPDNVSLVWNDDKSTEVTNGAEMHYDATSTHTRTIMMKYVGADAANPTYKEVGTVTIAQKEISTIIVTGDFEKDYDGTTDVKGVTYSLPAGTAVFEEVIGVTADIVYPNKNANAKPDKTLLGSEPYTMTVNGATLTGEKSGNYKLADSVTYQKADGSAISTGIIKQIALVIQSVPAAPAAQVEGSTVTDADRIRHMVGAKIGTDETTSIILESGEVIASEKDLFTADYDVTYADSSLTTPTSGANETLNVTPRTIKVNGTETTNYVVTWPANVKGVVVPSARTIEDLVAPTQIAETKIHADTLNLDGMSFTVKYQNNTQDPKYFKHEDGVWKMRTGDSGTFTEASPLSVGIDIIWTDGAQATQGSYLRHDTHNEKTLTVKATSSLGTDGYVKANTATAYTVRQKPLYVGMTVGNLDKVYDGTTALEAADLAAVDVKLYTDDAATAEYANAINDNISVDKSGIISYSQSNVNVGTTNPPTVQNVTMNVSDVTLGGTDADNYILHGNPTELKIKQNDVVKTYSQLEGKIEQKLMTIHVLSVPAKKERELTGEAETLASSYYQFETPVGDDGNDLNITVSYQYPAAVTDNNYNPDVRLTYSHPDNKYDDAYFNYKYTLESPISGTVQQLVVTGVEVTGPFDADNYTHGDTMNYKGLRIKATTNDEDVSYDYIYTDFSDSNEMGWIATPTDPASINTTKPSVAEKKDVTVDFTKWVKVNSQNEKTSDVTRPVRDRLVHTQHDGAHLEVTLTDDAGKKITGISTTEIKVKQKPIFARALIQNGEQLYKLYDGDADLDSDDQQPNNVDNRTKLNFEFYTDKSGDEQYRIYPADEGDDVRVDTSALGGEYGKTENGTFTADPNVARTGSWMSMMQLAADFNDDSIVAKPVQLSNLTLAGEDAENYSIGTNDFTDNTSLEGTIYPLHVTVTATADAVPQIYDRDTDLRVNLITTSSPETLQFSPSLLGDDRSKLNFDWKATYSADKSEITPDDSASIVGSAAAPNYAFEYTATSLAGKSQKAKATILEVTGEPAFASNPNRTHGDTVEELGGWEGFEYEVTYESNQQQPVTSKHRWENGAWKTNEGYEEPAEGTTFYWNGEQVSVDEINDKIVRYDSANDDEAKASKGNSITVKLDNASDRSEPTEVKQKEVTLKVTGEYRREYDGTTDITNPNFTYEALTPISGDTVGLKAGTEPTFEFTSDSHVENATAAGDMQYHKNVAVKSATPETDNINYVFAKDAENNYIIDITDVKGYIEPTTIKVTFPVEEKTASTAATDEDKAISGEQIPNIADEPDAEVTFTLVGGKIAVGDKVTIKFAGAYDDMSTANDAAALTFTTLEVDGTTNYAITDYIVTTDVTGVVKSATRRGGGGGGGGGGSTNKLTITYTDHDGNTVGSETSIKVPLGTDPVTLTASFASKMSNPAVTWTSSNEEVAKVDEDGKVTFVGVGEATITGQSKANKTLQDTIKVEVTEEMLEPTASPEPTESPEPVKRTHERERDSLITREMLNPYIVGYDDYVFGPELPISREELAAIFARLIANNLYMDRDYDVSFPDVPEKWSKSYIGYLEGFDVVTGYEDGTFKPENYITRAEMAVMMAKAEGYDITPDISADDVGFPDVDEGYATWSAAKAIQILSDLGIMEGYEDGTFRPGQPITRAETVATINRVLADMEVADFEVLPSDVTDAHWAYDDIVFAMNHRVLKDVSADPQRFLWSEEFEQNIITTTEQGETVTETVSDDDTANSEEISSEAADTEPADATETEAAKEENGEETAETSDATTTE